MIRVRRRLTFDGWRRHVSKTAAHAPRPRADMEEEALRSRTGIRFVDTPGSRIRARVARVDGAPTVVIFPDGPNTLEQYDPVFEHFSGSLSLVVMEIPGFGFSFAEDPLSLAFAGCVSDVVHALRSLDLGKMVLCGACVQAFVAVAAAVAMEQSTLGIVAMQATDQIGQRRWLHRAIDPNGILRTVGEGQRLWAEPARRERASIDQWYPAAAAEGFDVRGWQATARWAFAAGCSYALPSLVQSWLIEGQEPVPIWNGRGAVIFGSGDRTHSGCGSDPAGLMQLLPRAELHILPDAGHFPDLERLDVFVVVVADLARCR